MGSPGRLWSPGPVLLVLPLLFGVLLAVHLLTRRGGDGPPLDLDRGGVPAVAGWEGACPATQGGRVTARLTPLHAGAERQSFDAGALRARYDLPPGEPFRLELAWEAAPGDGAADIPPLDLAHVRVGADLAPLAGLLGEETGAGVRDPVAVLFGGPAGALAPGEERQIVLWGPALDGAEAVELQGLPGLGAGLRLVAADVPRGDLPRALARRAADGSEEEPR